MILYPFYSVLARREGESNKKQSGKRSTNRFAVHITENNICFSEHIFNKLCTLQRTYALEQLPSNEIGNPMVQKKAPSAQENQGDQIQENGKDLPSTVLLPSTSLRDMKSSLSSSRTREGSGRERSKI